MNAVKKDSIDDTVSIIEISLKRIFKLISDYFSSNSVSYMNWIPAEQKDEYFKRNLLDLSNGLINSCMLLIALINPNDEFAFSK